MAMGKSLKFLHDLILQGPHTDGRQRIVKIRGAEEGLDHIEITTKSKNSRWIHRIKTEEV